jgi:hypothetical protein
VWPGGRPNDALAGAFVQPPPLPANLQPVLLLSPCPAGQMRKAAPVALPGQVAPAQPCVPIPKGTPTQSGPAVKAGATTAETAAPAPVSPQ